jgi:hypothetical protein
MSNFSTPGKVLETIMAGDEVEAVRGRNRCKVLRSANGCPPLDEETAKKLGLKINVEWGELLEILVKARGQLIKAFLSNQYFFTVKLKNAPPEHQSEWESLITEEINRPLRESNEYFELHRSRWSSVVTHGVGPMVWRDREKWLPKFKAMADVRIPTDTTVDFANLTWFATRESYTVEELLKLAFSEEPNNRWNKEAVANILKNYKEVNFTDATNNYNFETEPEKLMELVKQNGGSYGSDALPTIPLWHFYFQQGDQWYQRVVPEQDTVRGADQDIFLWPDDITKDDPGEPEGGSWRQLIHCQFGDLSVDPPFKYAAVRGLGYILLEPTFYLNLTRNRLLQHVHDNFNIWLKTEDNPEKARVSVQQFGNMGVLKKGVSIVPQTERHQIQSALVETLFAQLTQLQANASSQYTQQADTGTEKEQTAFETRVKMEQVNAMMSSILLTAFKYEAGADREICRRFCIPNSFDEDVQEFQRVCKEGGIPDDFLKIKRWIVEPVTPLGMGNPTIAMTMAKELLAVRPMLPPQAQQEVLHEYLLIVTNDWRKAARWAPLKGPLMETDAKREMVGYFACLMEGVPVPLSQANVIDQLEALLPLYAAKIAQITKRDNMATQDEATGLANVSNYIGMALKQFSQDQTQKPKAKQFETIKMQQDNLARGIIQRGEQMRQKQAAAAQRNGAGGEMALKLREHQMESAQKSRSKEAETQQLLRHREQEFQQEQRHRATETMAGIAQDGFKALTDAANKRRSMFEEPESASTEE